MSATSRVACFYLAHLSKPKGDRAIYRHILRQKCRKILQIGIGDGQRALRMIRAAGRHHSRGAVQYAGIDLFESRSSVGLWSPEVSQSVPTGLTLKQAYRLLKPSGARVRLIPGDVYEALKRSANALGQIDLVVISADQHGECLERSWFYFPRMLHKQSCVLLETREPGSAESTLKVVDVRELEYRARKGVRRRAA